MSKSGKLSELIWARLRPGDAIEKAVKPFAVAVGAPCLDKDGRLKPDSGCAKRRDYLNNLFAKGHDRR
jgi:hypothetical protein